MQLLRECLQTKSALYASYLVACAPRPYARLQVHVEVPRHLVCEQLKSQISPVSFADKIKSKQISSL